MSGILASFFIAIWQVGIPIAMTSFLLIWWAMKHEYFGSVSSLKELELRVKEHNRTKKERKKREKIQRKTHKADPEVAQPEDGKVEENRKLNLVHNKWLAFGGGFYGVVALWTYIVIEFFEVRDFILNLGGFFAMLSNINFDLLIRLLIDSLMNFVWAIAWPGYWMTEIRMSDPWVWFGVAYLGYRTGFRLALHVHSRQASSR